MNNLIWEKWQQTRPRSPHGIPGQPEFRELGNGFSSEARDYLSQLPLIDLSAIGCELICGQDNVAMIWLYNNYCWGLRMNEYGRAQVTYMPNPTCLFWLNDEEQRQLADEFLTPSQFCAVALLVASRQEHWRVHRNLENWQPPRVPRRLPKQGYLLWGKLEGFANPYKANIWRGND